MANRSNSSIGACIFDCDGTLLDSTAMWERVRLELLASHGVEASPGDLARFEHLALEDECRAYHEEWGVGASGDELLHELWDRLMGEYSGRIEPRPGAERLLRGLAAAGVPLAVATSTPAPLVRAGLERAGFGDAFLAIATTGEAGRSKRFPDVYDLARERACEAAGRPPCGRGEAWVFEDAVFGLASARSAGYRCCGVHDGAGLNPRDELIGLSDLFCDSLEEVSPEDVLGLARGSR